MANFEPKWDLVQDIASMIEGQETYIRLEISKAKPEDTTNFNFDILDNEYLEFYLTINGSGETLTEQDFKVSVGESTGTLIPIENADENINRLFGIHHIKLNAKHFTLTGNSPLPVFYIKILCVDDGIWDGAEKISFSITPIKKITVVDNQITGNYEIGEMGNYTCAIKYDDAKEIWVTPDLTVMGNRLYTIGEISYGAESRLFGQAFGRSRSYDPITDTDSNDQSNRVFVPAYKAIDLSITEIPTKHITGHGTVINPSYDYIESIPAYTFKKGTSTNGINSFYMKNVALDNNGAGCLIQGKSLSDQDNSKYYLYGIKITSTADGSIFKLDLPFECSNIDVFFLYNDGTKNVLLKNISESVTTYNNICGRIDINGNIHLPAKDILIKPVSSMDIMMFVQIKLPINIIPPWISFSVYNKVNDTVKIKSSNTLDNLVFTGITDTRLLDMNAIDAILKVSSSTKIMQFNANNNKDQITNNIVPVQVRYPEERQLNILDKTNTFVDTGLKLNSNGQILQTFLYNETAADAYIKLQVCSIKEYYTTESDAYFVGKRFKAYQMWIAPSDVTHISTGVQANHLYMLKNTKIYPYTVKEIVELGEPKILFEPDIWIDLGLYDEKLGVDILGSTRTFRILTNAGSDSDIIFETDPNLGQIHVGEYFGHSTYPRIVASSDSQITYQINYESSPDNINKYNIDLTADGYLIGTAYATSIDFNQNDQIKLEFDVIATTRKGKQISKRFNLTIVRGFGQNYITAKLCPSLSLERSWFKMISTNTFSAPGYYRESDPRYGLQKVPRLLLKENYVDPAHDWVSLDDAKMKLKKHIIDVIGGAPTPDGIFTLTIGNYKVRSALDNSGNVLYDVLYREVFPSEYFVDPSTSATSYIDYKNNIISEIYGLRENIFSVLGQDIKNLLTDPDDRANRAVNVPEIVGLTSKMTDTVPRYMVHPYITGNIEPGYIPVIPVAYLQPGKGDALYTKLIQSGEHKTLLNTTFYVTGVEFNFFVQEFIQYVPENFVINLVSPSLL